jgi:hypothetical protein
MAEPTPGGESQTDYSPAVRSSADRIIRTAGHVHSLASVIRHLPTGVDLNVKVDLPDGSTDEDGSGTRVIDGIPVAKWIAPIVLWARAHGWHGRVTSGYRTVAQQRQACIHVCGNPNGCPNRCAKPGTSNHQYTEFPRGAVDVTDYDTFGAVVAHYPGEHTIHNALPLDPVHFSFSGR